MNSTKMNIATKLYVLLCVVFCLQNTNAQNTIQNQAASQLERNQGTIDNQFEYLITKSYNYTNARGTKFKSVRYYWLTELKANTLDSLSQLKKALDTTKSLVENQATEIENLKVNLSKSEKALTDSNNQKDSTSFFGLKTTKTLFNSIICAIIIGLIALLIWFIYKFKDSNELTKTAKYKLKEVEAEYEDHRRIAIEREQKVRRQLQDEINKNRKNTK